MVDGQQDTDKAIRDLAAANQQLASRLAAAQGENRSAALTGSHEAATVDRETAASGSIRRLGQAVTWPVRRILDPRFSGLARQIDAKQIDLFDRLERLRDESLAINHERAQSQNELRDLAKYQAEQLATASGLLQAQLEAGAEATAIVGRTLVDIRGDTQDAEATLRSLEKDLDDVKNMLGVLHPDLAGAAEIEKVGADVARLLNFANSHLGFAAQKGLWINHPVSLEYAAGEVRASTVNERIVEVPYAMRALCGIEPPAAIIDVGAAESTLSLSLASLGYRVTAVDPNGYPFDHPNLDVIEATLGDLPEGRMFSAALCISTIEHIGLAAYGQSASAEEDDLATMCRLRDALTPGGLLVLTVPFGAGHADERGRGYDRSTLDRLLEGWDVQDLTIVTRESKLTWHPVRGDGAAEEAVALVTARPR